MLHRTLPIMQLRERRFGDQWAERWSILDDSFLIMEQALADKGKQIASVLIEVVQRKFPFAPDCVFEDSQQATDGAARPTSASGENGNSDSSD
ncbi:unnamed protein product [marine sediment metagenome]|uniref:Uncharacterized protein n=1 Tax=marine sediment metagenome TaxID=412755 RepID=X0RP34_9ZZZZ